MDDFDEAIEISSNNPNPLYYCNKGRALFLLDKKDESLECFMKAQEYSSSVKSGEGLTESNIASIKKNLEPFIKQIQELNKIKLA